MSELENVRIAIKALKGLEQSLLQKQSSGTVRNTTLDEQTPHDYKWVKEPGELHWRAEFEVAKLNDQGEWVHPYPEKTVIEKDIDEADSFVSEVSENLAVVVKDEHAELLALLVRRVRTDGKIGVKRDTPDTE